MSDRRVLPPGEFNGIMLEPLPVYSGSSATTAVTVFAVMLLTDKHGYKQSYKHGRLACVCGFVCDHVCLLATLRGSRRPKPKRGKKTIIQHQGKQQKQTTFTDEKNNTERKCYKENR